MFDFKAKMHQIRFPLGSTPDPAGGAYSAPPDSLAVLKRGGKGKGRGEKWKGKGMDGKREGREEKGGEEGKGFISCILLFEPWQLWIGSDGDLTQGWGFYMLRSVSDMF